MVSATLERPSSQTSGAVHGPWTSEEEEYLIRTHSTQLVREQCEALGRESKDVNAKRTRMLKKGLLVKGQQFYMRRWSSDDDQWLSDNYHRFTIKTLMRKLDRTECAIALRKKRLGIRRSDAFYTARMAADVLGLSCSKQVIVYRDAGLIKARRAPYLQGAHRPWVFMESGLRAFVTRYPFLCARQKMERHFLSSVYQEQWAKDPWYSCKDAAQMVGIGDDALQRRLRSGEVPAFQLHPNRKWSRWWIRKSDLEAHFERHDTPAYRSASSTRTQANFRSRSGIPRKVFVMWEMSCPRCGAVGRKRARARVTGTAVQGEWLESHICLDLRS